MAVVLPDFENGRRGRDQHGLDFSISYADGFNLQSQLCRHRIQPDGGILRASECKAG